MNKHTIYRTEFHQWIIEEWNKKDTPVVWMVGVGRRKRLWDKPSPYIQLLIRRVE
jgi:hypothetical protein